MDIRKFTDGQNIVDFLDENSLLKIGSEVSEDFSNDKACRAEKDTRLEEAGKIVQQVIETKNYPFPNASNIKYPLTTKAVIEFNARVSPLIINNGEVVKIKASGGENELVERDGNFEISQETGVFKTEQEERNSRARKVQDMMNWIITETGDWEEEKDRLTLVYALSGFAATKNYFDYSESLPKSELVLPSDLYWEAEKTFDKASRKSQVIRMDHNKIIEKMRLGEFREVDTLMSENRQDEEEVLIETHTWLDLDEDGYKEPYIVVFAENGGDVLRITPRFKEILESEGKILKITPREHFVFYQFIPAPDGSSFPLGLCDLLLFVNEGINTNLNQLIDAGTIANIGGGFISGNVRIKGGQQPFVPGEFKKVENAGSDLAKSIVTLPVKEPSQALFSLLGVLIDSGKDLAMLSDVLSGDINPNVPATTVLAMIEQSLSGFKAILKRLQRSLKRELGIFYELISRNFFEIKQAYSHVQEVEAVELKDFILDYAVIPVSDEYYSTSLEKAKRAEFFMGLASSGNPFINPLEATKRGLQLLNIENWEDLIAEPQPQQPDPLVMLQAQVLQSQIKRAEVQNQIDLIKMTLEKMRTDSEVSNDALKTQSENIKRGAEAISALANAESKEGGVNNPEYIRQAEEVSDYSNIKAKENINEQLGNSQRIFSGGLEGVQVPGAG